MKRAKRSELIMTVQRHPWHPESHIIVMLEHEGYIYACVYAGQREDYKEDEFWADYRRNPRNFLPYDQSTGQFC